MIEYQKNVACIELDLNYKNKRIYFNDKRLHGNKINWMFLYASTEDVVVLSPFSENMIMQIHEIGEINLSLNLTNENNSQIIKEMDFSEMTFTTESRKIRHCKVNDLVNLESSYFECILPESKWNYKLLLYVCFQTNKKTPKKESFEENSFSFIVPVTKETEDICLNDFVSNELNGKKITNIVFNSKHNTSAYLDLKGADRNLDNLPVTIFQSTLNEKFAIAPIEIELKNSFYRNRAFFIDPNDVVQLTFFYQ